LNKSSSVSVSPFALFSFAACRLKAQQVIYKFLAPVEFIKCLS